MRIFGKRREPVTPVVLPDHAVAALTGMEGDQSMARARLESVLGELMGPERVLACAENYAPWTNDTSLWVVTNRRLFEIRKDQSRNVPLACITGVSHGRRDIDYVIVFDVPSPDGDDWSPHPNEQLVFASHETRDAKRLLGAFNSMFGL